jgi:hypothetical protein
MHPPPPGLKRLPSNQLPPPRYNPSQPPSPPTCCRDAILLHSCSTLPLSPLGPPSSDPLHRRAAVAQTSMRGMPAAPTAAPSPDLGPRPARPAPPPPPRTPGPGHQCVNGRKVLVEQALVAERPQGVDIRWLGGAAAQHTGRSTRAWVGGSMSAGWLVLPSTARGRGHACVWGSGAPPHHCTPQPTHWLPLRCRLSCQLVLAAVSSLLTPLGAPACGCGVSQWRAWVSDSIGRAVRGARGILVSPRE